MFKSSANRPPLGVECLESRFTPAGNVAAFLSGGTVSVFGDGDNNQVTIEQRSNGEVVITGNQTTNVNGSQSATFGGGGNPAGVYVDMGDGGDTLNVNNLGAGSIVLLGGNGNDSLRMTNSGAVSNVE